MTLSSILISRGLSTAFDATDYSLSEMFSPFGFERSCPHGFPASSLAIPSPMLDPSSPQPSNAGGSQDSDLRPLLCPHSLPWESI